MSLIPLDECAFATYNFGDLLSADESRTKDNMKKSNQKIKPSGFASREVGRLFL